MTTDLIYLAAPYSHESKLIRFERFEKINAMAARLMQARLYIFSPISHTHPIAEAGELPKGWEYWKWYDEQYLAVCKAMIVYAMQGHLESIGVQAEIRFMESVGRRVLYAQDHTVDGFLKDLRNGKVSFCR